MKSQNIVAPVKATTQQFVEIEAVEDDIVLLNDRRCCCIIKTTGVNFQLLSPPEQDSVIYSFSQLLNSLSFPIQILITSKKTDISEYLDYLDSVAPDFSKPKLVAQFSSYKEFIKSIVKINTIVEKSFFVVIPFSPLEMGAMAMKKTDHSYVFARAKVSLYPKRDHIIKMLNKNNMDAKVLLEQEIVELFYNQFNPSLIGKQLAPIKSYTNLVASK